MKHIEQTLTSMEVAEMVGKKHNELLKDIRRYVKNLNEGNFPHVDFFKESFYQDTKGEDRPCYAITKKGCDFIANKMTGVKGTVFTAKYINRFHEMEEVIAIPTSTSGQIHLLAQGYTELEGQVKAISKDLQDFKMDLPLLAVECEKITKAAKSKGVEVLGGKTSEAYMDKSIRNKVYSDIYNEVKRQFGVCSYKAIKRSQCDRAVEVINNYQLPIALADEIDLCNAQMNMQEAI